MPPSMDTTTTEKHLVKINCGDRCCKL